MPANDNLAVLVMSLVLALVGFGVAVSRVARLFRLAGMAALAYGVYAILALTHTLR